MLATMVWMRYAGQISSKSIEDISIRYKKPGTTKKVHRDVKDDLQFKQKAISVCGGGSVKNRRA